METKTCSQLQKLVRAGYRAFSAHQKPAAVTKGTRGPHSGTRGPAAPARVLPRAYVAQDAAPEAPHERARQPVPKIKQQTFTPQPRLSEEEMLANIFAKDSTTALIKKFFVYKLMGSDLFINYSLGLMNLAYKCCGVKATNFVINKSVGSLFTAGESIDTLVEDMDSLEKHNIYGIANYVVEGLAEMDEPFIQGVYEHMLESIHAQTEGRSEGHFALKLTALISTDTMTRLSRAQQVFMNDILKFDKQEPIDVGDLRNSLLERGIQFSQEELDQLFRSLQFEHNETDSLSRLEIYANAHLLRLDPAQRTGLLRRIAIGCGVGVSEDDL